MKGSKYWIAGLAIVVPTLALGDTVRMGSGESAVAVVFSDPGQETNLPVRRAA